MEAPLKVEPTMNLNLFLSEPLITTNPVLRDTCYASDPTGLIFENNIDNCYTVAGVRGEPL